MKKNYYSLLLMRILKLIIQIFTDSFLVLYFIQLSNNSIIPYASYCMFMYTALVITIYVVRNYIKSYARVYVLRLGMLFNFIFFFLLLLLNDKMINYAPLLGIIYGIEEGLYFSVFNIYESKISKTKLPNYLGTYTSINAIMSIVIPIVFGSIMSFSGFGKCTIIVLILVLLKLILTLIYKDDGKKKIIKVRLKKYISEIKNNKTLLVSHMVSFNNGLVYAGAFSSLITIYIINVFKTGFSLGIITSILSLVTAIAGFIFAKYIKVKGYGKVIKIFNILTIICLILMMINCNPVTIIIFNFVQSVAKPYTSLINSNNLLAVSNQKGIKEKYKEEYFIIHETFIYLGRIVGYLVFTLLVFANSNFINNIIMMIFILFIISRMIFSLWLQNIIYGKK